MTTQDIALIANHPFVRLCFPMDTYRWAFARYFLTVQACSPWLLSLRESVDHYMRASLSELAEEVFI